MKKIITILCILFISLESRAQEKYSPLTDQAFMSEMGRTAYVILLFALIMGFIIAIIKMLLDYRIKRKMIDKGISEELASKLLQTGKNSKNEALKWFLILLSIGTGFLLVGLNQPLGLHSIAIIAFTMAAGFITYYFLIRKPE